jgi:hypothetical protein
LGWWVRLLGHLVLGLEEREGEGSGLSPGKREESSLSIYIFLFLKIISHFKFNFNVFEWNFDNSNFPENKLYMDLLRKAMLLVL